MSEVDLLIFGSMALFGALYAVLLRWGEAHGTTAEWQTELTVLGVGITLGMAGLFAALSRLEYWKLRAAFAATGGPVVFRRWLKRFSDGQKLRRQVIDHATPRE